MVNLDYSLLLQVVNFIILIFLLNFIVFRPILRIIDERKEKTEGTLADARRLMDEAEALLSEYNEKVSDAQQRAVGIINEGRAKAIEEQRVALADAKKKAEEHLRLLEERIGKERKEAAQKLSSFAKIFSINIAEKLLDRPLGSGERVKWDS